MKEWRFVGLCLLLGGLIFFSLNQFARALQPQMNPLNGNMAGWEIEAIATNFEQIEAVSRDHAWALRYDDKLPDRIYRYNGTQWQLERIFHPTEDVFVLDMVSATDGWAIGRVYAGVGTGGTGTLWRYDGHSWNRFPMPVAQHIFALDMHSSTEGWALGDQSLLKFDGVKWNEVGPGMKLSSRNNSHYYLRAFSETQAWLKYGLATYFYNGTQWEQVSELSRAFSFAMSSSTEGWAYYENYPDSSDRGVLRYDGTTWSKVSEPASLRSMSVVSPDNIWALKSENELHHYNGQVWSVVTLPNDAPNPISISMTADGSGWILGNDGRMIRYTDGTWIVEESNTLPMHLTSNDLRQVRVISNAISVVNNARHLSGDRWTSPPLHPESQNFITAISGREIVTPTAINLTNFDVSAPGQGWAIGSLSYTYRFSNNGREQTETVDNLLFEFDSNMWKPIKTITMKYHNAFDMVSALSGWAVSNSPWAGVLQSYDGNSWSNHSVADTELYDIQMLLPDRGWAVGNSSRMMSTVGLPNRYSAVLHYDGTGWTTIENTPGHGLYAIDMLSETEGWAVGAAGTILHYVDGRWLLEPSPTEMNLYDIDMIYSQEGWAIGHYTERLGVDFVVCNSAILHYDGTSWQVASELNGFCLRSISVLDSDTGRIVGDEGLVLKLPGAYEPLPEPTATPSQPIPLATSTVGVTGEGGDYAIYLPMIAR